ncbi:MFS transporter [Parafrankia sp. BMG5.11]|uniref:MFS transporter n=1 Tax=Parafrankia sp. BMG5.11 TaxID=222540 RepID=UPI00103F171A|nr:MFS transporter [Parafrankia sp. BMG5.11]TCJ31624.1 MFS transporter [Parafrankia sp. BMG5.11]
MEKSARSALTLLAGTQFLLILDTAIINVAAPSIGDEFDVSAATLSWVANAYLVTFGGLLLLSGRLADLFGRRRLFLTGLAVLVAASLTGAVAQTASWLIAARAVQGAGAALAAAAAFALLLSLFPDGPDRHRALGVFAAMAGAGGAAGTVLGGVLTSWLTWRSTFGLNVVAGLVLVGSALRSLAPDTRPSARLGFDLGGALSVTSGLALLAYSLVNTGVAGWTSPRTLVPGVTAVVLLAVFVWLEGRVRVPLVPAAVVRRPVLRRANLLSALGQVVLFPMFFLVSVYLQDVLGYSPVAGGSALLPLCVVVILVASNADRLIGGLGLRPAMTAGYVLVAVGMAWLSLLSPDGSFTGDILLPSLILGVGLPLVAITTNVAATADAGPEEIGLASGLINTSQQFGSVIGLAVLSGIASARVSAEGGPDDPAALTSGFAVAFIVASAIALLSALYAAVPRTARPQQEPTRERPPVSMAAPGDRES